MRRNSEHWLEFDVIGMVGGTIIEERVRIHFTKAWDMNDGWKYRAAKGNAARRAKDLAGVHRCAASKLLTIGPHDWSDTMDAATHTNG